MYRSWEPEVQALMDVSLPLPCSGSTDLLSSCPLSVYREATTMGHQYRQASEHLCPRKSRDYRRRCKHNSELISDASSMYPRSRRMLAPHTKVLVLLKLLRSVYLDLSIVSFRSFLLDRTHSYSLLHSATHPRPEKTFPEPSISMIASDVLSRTTSTSEIVSTGNTLPSTTPPWKKIFRPRKPSEGCKTSATGSRRTGSGRGLPQRSPWFAKL